MARPTEQELIDDILLLSEEVWENRVTRVALDDWLDNFVGRELGVAEERIQALHLLSHFAYFGQGELRHLLLALYRDLFRYPIVQQIRQDNGMTRDSGFIEAAFREELRRTRFVGMGNPSESGSHLLYYFRQENGLHRDLFVSPHQLLDGQASSVGTGLVPSELKRIVFIDDVLGSGQQALEYGRTVLSDIREVAARSGSNIDIWYLVLFAKPEGLINARRAPFDVVQAVHELDASQAVFSSNSYAFTDLVWSPSLSDSEKMSRGYGEPLFPGNSVGYREGQLLLGLHHNVPDNTLPVFWNDEHVKSWKTLFKRYPKDAKW